MAKEISEQMRQTQKQMQAVDEESNIKGGTNAAIYRNPAYQGYQDTISLSGNKSNGLLTRANANDGGVAPKEMLQNLSSGQPATTEAQKFSDTTTSVKNVSSTLANGVINTF